MFYLVFSGLVLFCLVLSCLLEKKEQREGTCQILDFLTVVAVVVGNETLIASRRKAWWIANKLLGIDPAHGVLHVPAPHMTGHAGVPQIRCE